MEELQLNEHNKQEYPPMHTDEFDTLLIYQNYFCIYNYFIFKTLTILQT